MKRTSLLATMLVLAATVLVAAGCQPEAPCPQASQPTTVAYRKVAGVDPNLLSLDVHVPTTRTCGAPVVVWVHGGGYVTGDKRNAMADKVRWAGSHGWILVSVNYRLSTPGDPHKAQFPDHFDDVASSIAWVKANIARYGGDGSKLAVLGHSAGADIVSNVTVNPTYLAAHGLALGDVSCAAPLDTEGFDKVAAAADGDDEQWENALGNDPAYLTDTSATLVATKGTGIPPTLGVYRGTAQRQQIEKAFTAKLSSLGVPTATVDARALTHEEVNKRIGAVGDTVVTPPLTFFLASCFRS